MLRVEGWSHIGHWPRPGVLYWRNSEECGPVRLGVWRSAAFGSESDVVASRMADPSASSVAQPSVICWAMVELQPLGAWI